MRSSNGPSLPRAASSVSAPATIAAENTCSKRSSASSASAVDTCVPLISARPSFGPRTSGASPASRSTAAAGRRIPSTTNSPSPISAAVRWASGARSPEAPTEPCAGMQGTSPARTTASSASTTSSRTPECPRARLAALSAITSRTTGADSGTPTPTQWERIRFCCSVASSAAGMCVLASLPKPVFTPYTGASPRAARATIAAPSRSGPRAASARVSGTASLRIARRSSSVRAPGRSCMALVSRARSSSSKGERETARCIVAALADIRDIRFVPLRAAHRFRRLCVRRPHDPPSLLRRTSDSGHYRPSIGRSRPCSRAHRCADS